MSDVEMLDDEDIAWQEDDDLEPTPALSKTVEPFPEPPAEPPAEPENLDKLKQKLRSAEGRYRKFGEDIDDMRAELAAREPEPPASADTAPLLPDGWSERDWEDFVADSPVEAELLQAQNERMATLQQRFDTSEQQRLRQEQLQQFRATVLGAHADYETLMQQEGDQVRAFIANQSNPLVKKAYEQVYQQGTAEEVVELVNQYKRSRGSGDRQARVDASMAVPTRTSMPDMERSGGLPDIDDEDAAWDYFSDEQI